MTGLDTEAPLPPIGRPARIRVGCPLALVQAHMPPQPSHIRVNTCPPNPVTSAYTQRASGQLPPTREGERGRFPLPPDTEQAEGRGGRRSFWRLSRVRVPANPKTRISPPPPGPARRPHPSKREGGLCLSVCLSVGLAARLSVWLPDWLFGWLAACLSSCLLCLAACLSVRLPVRLFPSPSVPPPLS